MRDPKRIPRMIKELEKQWERFPDWRFTQLIFNVFGGLFNTTEPRFFYFEDDKSEMVIAEFLRDPNTVVLMGEEEHRKYKEAKKDANDRA